MLDIQALRQRFHFIRGNYLVIALTRILGMFSRSMVFPYASLFILALDGDPTQIGFVNALKPLAGLLMFPIAGYLTDHVGRVKLIALGGYLSGIVVLMFVLAWVFVSAATAVSIVLAALFMRDPERAQI